MQAIEYIKVIWCGHAKPYELFPSSAQVNWPTRAELKNGFQRQKNKTVALNDKRKAC